MATRDLSGLYISASFQRLLQADPNSSGTILDGTGSIASALTVSGSLTVTETLFAERLRASHSIIFTSGSTIFGDVMTDTHEFTGSIYVTGSISVTPQGTVNPLTSSWAVSSSYAESAATVTGGGSTVWYEGTTYATSSRNIKITGSLDTSGSFTQGAGNAASGLYSHAEGSNTQATGNYSHAEGQNTKALGVSSHAEGLYSVANGNYSHAEGQGSFADVNGHAEGFQTSASMDFDHSEGYNTIASGSAAHAEGSNTQATGAGSHAEGHFAIATGDYSHAEGTRTTTIGMHSHAEGSGSIAYGIASHAEGINTIASGSGQNVVGHYNIHGNTNSLFIIGDGTADGARSDLALFNASSITFNTPVSSSIFSGSFVGDGSNLTGLSAGLWSGSAANPRATGDVEITGSLKVSSGDLYIGNDGENNKRIYFDGGPSWISSQQSGGDIIISGSDDLFLCCGDDIVFCDNTVEKMRYDGGLDAFGIGTTTPAEKLTVAGNISSSGYYYGDGSNLTGLPASDPFPYSGSAIISSSFTPGDTSSNTLKLIGSGSVSGSGIFEIQGSTGTLFSAVDSMSGSLMAVTDASGIPILEVFSNNTVTANGFKGWRPIETRGSSFVLQLTDIGTYNRCHGQMTASLSASSAIPFPIGTEIEFVQTSSLGNLYITASNGSGITLNSKNNNQKLAGQWSAATIKKVGTDEWDIVGDLT